MWITRREEERYPPIWTSAIGQSKARGGAPNRWLCACGRGDSVPGAGADGLGGEAGRSSADLGGVDDNVAQV
jgi:hypothetical protein